MRCQTWENVIFLVIMIYFVTDTHCLPSTCASGDYCDRCSPSHIKIVQSMNRATGQIRPLKVCCPCCSKYVRAKDDGNGTVYCDCLTEEIQGNCWKGEQCEHCNNGYVGNINGLPVCCENCEKSGLELSPKHCNCLHNGP